MVPGKWVGAHCRREEAGARWLGPQSLLVGVMGMNEEGKVVWLSSSWFALLGELKVPTQR